MTDLFIPVAVQRAGELSDTLQTQLSETKPTDTPEKEPKDTLPPNVVGDLPATPPAGTDTTDYKAKYLALQGKYNAEVPKLTMEIRNLKSQVASLEEQNSTLITKTQNVDKGEALDKEQFEQYGKEFGALVDEIQRLKKQNADISAQMNSITSGPTPGADTYSTYMTGVIDAIARLGANFDAMNSDPAFIGWLKQVPPGGYESNLAKLHRAENAKDLPSTVEIFKAYLGQVNPTTQTSGNPPPAKPNIQPPHTLTGSDVNPNPAGDKKVWSRAEIMKFHTDQTAGLYRGREAEMAAKDADIFLAVSEGRISA